MTDQLEHDLRILLRERAAATETTSAPLARIAAEGDVRRAAIRRRRAGIVASLVAAAAVAAIAVPVALHGAGERTAPPIGTDGQSPTTAIAPLDVPYLHRGVLHVGGLQIPTPGADYVEWSGGTTLVGDWRPPGHISWSVVRGTRLVPLRQLRDNVGPPITPDGTTVAAVSNPTAATTRIAFYAVATGAALGHVDLDIARSCCSGGAVQPLGFDMHGLLYWNQPDGTYLWSPGLGRDPERLAAQSRRGTVSEVGAAGPVLATGDGRGYVMLSAGDAPQDGVTTPVDSGAVFAPDGFRMAYAIGAQIAAKTGTTAIPPTVTTLEQPQQKTPLRLPPGDDFEDWVGFSDATHVLLIVRRDAATYRLVQCDATTGECAETLGLGRDLNAWTFPHIP